MVVPLVRKIFSSAVEVSPASRAYLKAMVLTGGISSSRVTDSDDPKGAAMLSIGGDIGDLVAKDLEREVFKPRGIGRCNEIRERGRILT